MIWLLAGAVLLGGAWMLVAYLRHDAKQNGRLEVANKTQDGVIKDVEEANIIRDRFKSDPAYRERVQSRFERDE
jgi:hypothetical protein